MKDGFPELTDSFLAGQDIFYAQFNDIEFYVEDTEQEHFYFNILKNLFPDLKFEKIFPLNGKDNIKKVAKTTIGDKKKIYLLDLDFDGILGTKEKTNNLFYLEKYSIENYLFSKNSLYEIIREKDSKLKNQDIDGIFNYQNLLNQCACTLTELACSCLIIQKHSLGLDYFGLSPARDFDFSNDPPTYRNNFITQFFDTVEIALKKIKGSFTLKGQIKKIVTYFKTLKEALSNIPGKYILNFIKNRLESLSLISQTKLESFVYKLSKEVNPNDLAFLKNKVIDYMK